MHTVTEISNILLEIAFVLNSLTGEAFNEEIPWLRSAPVTNVVSFTNVSHAAGVVSAGERGGEARWPAHGPAGGGVAGVGADDQWRRTEPHRRCNLNYAIVIRSADLIAHVCNVKRVGTLCVPRVVDSDFNSQSSDYRNANQESAISTSIASFESYFTLIR